MAGFDDHAVCITAPHVFTSALLQHAGLQPRRGQAEAPGPVGTAS
jgi:hypothetical protein